jgi:hypothetical protein
MRTRRRKRVGRSIAIGGDSSEPLDPISVPGLSGSFSLENRDETTNDIQQLLLLLRFQYRCTFFILPYSIFILLQVRMIGFVSTG